MSAEPRMRVMSWSDVIWPQFGAAIDMLEDAIRACPDAFWDAPADERGHTPPFGYLAYHSLFFLDYYLADDPAAFAPPAPFTRSELVVDGPMPERVATREELLDWLGGCRARCRAALDGLTEERAAERRRYGWGELGLAELMLYNMRHLQHHAGQLHLLLRQSADATPGWVVRARGGARGGADR